MLKNGTKNISRELLVEQMETDQIKAHMFVFYKRLISEIAMR